jgi:hypothetical protein
MSGRVGRIVQARESTVRQLAALTIHEALVGPQAATVRRETLDRALDAAREAVQLVEAEIEDMDDSELGPPDGDPGLSIADLVTRRRLRAAAAETESELAMAWGYA